MATKVSAEGRGEAEGGRGGGASGGIRIRMKIKGGEDRICPRGEARVGS